ncbi:MAG: tRNA (N(6)-L-threonylcarbamoyladenosine(37)-C(2))-methylthiotransferase [Euryarchaeota archaeon]|nr:tRNA (N(6)-L-threonylcarbamoyladenosine(37)-C(2))-methylthiotransferase [Euryarchaeota archaeon]MBU4608014.1 tRNA (N(6)-L-threonylcarbamoyladenosine(37)-C(2))-methylthiotransferase [Euryarchaeota archaeon]MBV1728657.1 tRNA (N(6)-L-threonylcarbamoyladenosine(37)-C(2))-methylthiotransferase [Methanobacterium sp.]MBV1754739.1 tRNA (N(6)-L-threonylcarbamoyladenosine(37)-C(2))-methylthiotransferase [Methanobacterium sp.]
MKVYIETFGCTFNQADSQIMAGILSAENINIVSNLEDSQVVIINTCYVKHPTEHKVINRIQKIQKDFPEKKLIVGGCMVEIEPDKLSRIAPEAGWIGPHQIQKVPQLVKSVLDGKNDHLTGISSGCKVGLPKIRSNPLIHIIQICEGCMGKCTYCCTRFARGGLQSYPKKLIVEEALQALSEGCVEIQLTAQDTAAYGKDTGEKLSDLINEITALEGNFRLRIGMMHPKSMMDDVDGLIDAFKSNKVYKFIHIPIQSGSNQVLADMNRCHTVNEYQAIINNFRREIPEITLATDIIVAYPTEDEEAFKDTCDFLKEIKPNFVHISKYKHRHLAESSKMDEIEFKELKRRSKMIEKIKTEITHQNNLGYIGTIQEVLIVEKGKKGGFIGRTNSYMPVVVKDVKTGEFMHLEIKDSTSTYLKAFNDG